MIALIL